MNLATVAHPVLIHEDADGVVRIGDTRVRLASLIYHHEQGATSEEIRERFPSLSLADVYATIAYYLRHRDEVDEYLAQIDAEAEKVRRTIEARPSTQALREKLLARRDSVR